MLIIVQFNGTLAKGTLVKLIPLLHNQLQGLNQNYFCSQLNHISEIVQLAVL